MNIDTRIEYESGLHVGYAYAEADRADSAPFASCAAELVAEAREAREDAPCWRAFKLGVVRGYREDVRTLRDGRWGL